jgi:hypothetical protein
MQSNMGRYSADLPENWQRIDIQGLNFPTGKYMMDTMHRKAYIRSILRLGKENGLP